MLACLFKTINKSVLKKKKKRCNYITLGATVYLNILHTD